MVEGRFSPYLFLAFIVSYGKGIGQPGRNIPSLHPVRRSIVIKLPPCSSNNYVCSLYDKRSSATLTLFFTDGLDVILHRFLHDVCCSSPVACHPKQSQPHTNPSELCRNRISLWLCFRVFCDGVSCVISI